MQIARRPNAVAGPYEIRLRKHQSGRQPAIADQLLRTIAVDEDPIEQRGALDQRSLEHLPFGRGNDERNRIEPPRPFDAGRVTVNMIRDALFRHEPARGFPAPADFTRRQPFEIVQEAGVVGADTTVRSEGFVESILDRIASHQTRARRVDWTQDTIAHGLGCV
jgi:hypothetical protein